MSERTAVLELVRAAENALERNRARIDDLNVYPVPDGDTGTNMLLTVRAVTETLQQTVAKSDRAELAQEVARAALLGARGNSGVILSQIARGAAEVLGAADRLDSGVVAAALRRASDEAYAAVREPVEGTILTAIRALADEAEAHKGLPLTDLLRELTRRGDEAVEQTREQLDILRQAGVVDAGAAGLVEIVRGLAAHLAGEPLPDVIEAEPLSAEAIHQEASRFRYCVVFVVEGQNLEAAALEREERLARAPDIQRTTAVVAVVAGEGNRRLFESMGAAAIVDGGETMNPSTEALLDAIEGTRSAEAVVLANNDNVVLAARQAARLADKPVYVVPSGSLQAGLGAMLAYDPAAEAEANAAAMEEAAAAVATGSVTVASRTVSVDGLKVARGAYLGLAGGEPIAGGTSFDTVAVAVVERLLAEPRDILTFITGADEPELG